MSLSNRLLRLSTILLILLIGACSHHSVRPDSEEKILLQNALENMSSEYSNPRLVTGELIVSVKNIELLSSDVLIESNQANGINAEQPPSLHIWSSGIRDYPTQQMLSESTINPLSDHSFVDSEYGNQIS